jgi:hypothetical protein
MQRVLFPLQVSSFARRLSNSSAQNSKVPLQLFKTNLAAAPALTVHEVLPGAADGGEKDRQCHGFNSLVVAAEGTFPFIFAAWTSW